MPKYPTKQLAPYQGPGWYQQPPSAGALVPGAGAQHLQVSKELTNLATSMAGVGALAAEERRDDELDEANRILVKQGEAKFRELEKSGHMDWTPTMARGAASLVGKLNAQEDIRKYTQRMGAATIEEMADVDFPLRAYEEITNARSADENEYTEKSYFEYAVGPGSKGRSMVDYYTSASAKIAKAQGITNMAVVAGNWVNETWQAFKNLDPDDSDYTDIRENNFDVTREWAQEFISGDDGARGWGFYTANNGEGAKALYSSIIGGLMQQGVSPKDATEFMKTLKVGEHDMTGVAAIKEAMSEWETPGGELDKAQRAWETQIEAQNIERITAWDADFMEARALAESIDKRTPEQTDRLTELFGTLTEEIPRLFRLPTSVAAAKLKLHGIKVQWGIDKADAQLGAQINAATSTNKLVAKNQQGVRTVSPLLTGMLASVSKTARSTQAVDDVLREIAANNDEWSYEAVKREWLRMTSSHINTLATDLGPGGPGLLLPPDPWNMAIQDPYTSPAPEYDDSLSETDRVSLLASNIINIVKSYDGTHEYFADRINLSVGHYKETDDPTAFLNDTVEGFQLLAYVKAAQTLGGDMGNMVLAEKESGRMLKIAAGGKDKSLPNLKSRLLAMKDPDSDIWKTEEEIEAIQKEAEREGAPVPLDRDDVIEIFKEEADADDDLESGIFGGSDIAPWLEEQLASELRERVILIAKRQRWKITNGNQEKIYRMAVKELYGEGFQYFGQTENGSAIVVKDRNQEGAQWAYDFQAVLLDEDGQARYQNADGSSMSRNQALDWMVSKMVYSDIGDIEYLREGIKHNDDIAYGLGWALNQYAEPATEEKIKKWLTETDDVTIQWVGEPLAGRTEMRPFIPFPRGVQLDVFGQNPPSYSFMIDENGQTWIQVGAGDLAEDYVEGGGIHGGGKIAVDAKDMMEVVEMFKNHHEQLRLSGGPTSEMIEKDQEFVAMAPSAHQEFQERSAAARTAAAQYGWMYRNGDTDLELAQYQANGNQMSLPIQGRLVLQADSQYARESSISILFNPEYNIILHKDGEVTFWHHTVDDKHVPRHHAIWNQTGPVIPSNATAMYLRKASYTGAENWGYGGWGTDRDLGNHYTTPITRGSHSDGALGDLSPVQAGTWPLHEDFYARDDKADGQFRNQWGQHQLHLHPLMKLMSGHTASGYKQDTAAWEDLADLAITDAGLKELTPEDLQKLAEMSFDFKYQGGTKDYEPGGYAPHPRNARTIPLEWLENFVNFDSTTKAFVRRNIGIGSRGLGFNPDQGPGMMPNTVVVDSIRTRGGHMDRLVTYDPDVLARLNAMGDERKFRYAEYVDASFDAAFTDPDGAHVDLVEDATEVEQALFRSTEDTAGTWRNFFGFDHTGTEELMHYLDVPNFYGTLEGQIHLDAAETRWHPREGVGWSAGHSPKAFTLASMYDELSKIEVLFKESDYGRKPISVVLGANGEEKMVTGERILIERELLWKQARTLRDHYASHPIYN